MAGYFITGTDTGVGKTWISCALIRQLRQQGQRVAGMKPVASGCEHTPQGLRNADALALMQVANVELPYEQVNRYAFAPAIAPHIAAEHVGVSMDIDLIDQDYQTLQKQADQVVVEGVGGWLVPLTHGKTMQDLAVRLQLPVIMVVAIRLGCISHALLTAQAIRQSGLPLAGWVANQVDAKVENVAEQVETLKQRLGMLILGELEHMDEGENLENLAGPPDQRV